MIFITVADTAKAHRQANIAIKTGALARFIAIENTGAKAPASHQKYKPYWIQIMHKLHHLVLATAFITTNTQAVPITYDVMIGDYRSPGADDQMAGYITLDQGDYLRTITFNSEQVDIFSVEGLLDWNVTIDGFNWNPSNSFSPRVAVGSSYFGEIYEFVDLGTFTGVDHPISSMWNPE